MSKAPASQFYWNDWARDLSEHDLEIEGAWIRICCCLWNTDSRYEATKSLESWMTILGKSRQKTIKLFFYLKEKRIGNISFACEKPDKNMQKSTEITALSRRMKRDEEKRIANKNKQKDWYDRQRDEEKPNPILTENKPDSNPEPNQNLTSLFSLQSSSSVATPPNPHASAGANVGEISDSKPDKPGSKKSGKPPMRDRQVVFDHWIQYHPKTENPFADFDDAICATLKVYPLKKIIKGIDNYHIAVERGSWGGSEWTYSRWNLVQFLTRKETGLRFFVNDEPDPVSTPATVAAEIGARADELYSKRADRKLWCKMDFSDAARKVIEDPDFFISEIMSDERGFERRLLQFCKKVLEGT